jgi:hypothetical protein
MAEESKKFDPEKTLVTIMNEMEKGLNTMADKLKEKRQELEEKGLDATVQDTVEKAKAGSKAIAEDIQKDAEKLKKNIEAMLKEL